MPTKLLLSERFIETQASRLSEFGPAIEMVGLNTATDPSVSDEIDAAFFSSDCYPDLAAEFMTAVLSAPNLGWLQTFSAGVDHPIFASLTDKGVQVTNASGASAVPISQAVLMNILALSRQLPVAIRNQTDCKWERLEGRDLLGSTAVVLGFGPIGRAVAKLLPAVGIRPIVVRRAVVGDEPCETWPMTRLAEALTIADQLVVALPATPDTIGIIDSAALGALPNHALLVNVGRGELLDEDALAEACANGALGGAALDVFQNEPLPPTSPLWSLPNVIITPHIAARTPATDAATVDIFFANLQRFVQGKPLSNLIA